MDPLTGKFPMLTPYQFASNSPISGVDLDGLEFYYAADGKFLGKVGESKEVYTAEKLEKDVATNAKALNINNDYFVSKAATVYGESSHAYGIDSKEEIFAIASVHEKNSTAYGASSGQATTFKNTDIDKRNGTFMQTANAAVINALSGGTDYSNGATMWDGAEQALYDGDDFSSGGFEYHMNTMGWTISDDNFKSWKAAVGSGFKATQLKYTPGKNPKNKWATANTIALKSTAQYGKTIFWKELKTRLKKPEEKKPETTTNTNEVKK